ncbi:MAG: hypothetical protein U0527_15045 [Candidatus Eisenbacteria bacterium]
MATPEELDGTHFRAAIDWWQQGALNQRDRRVSTRGSFTMGEAGRRDAWAVTLRGATTGGERPPQSKPSLGGQAGLGGFRPWRWSATLYSTAARSTNSRVAVLKRTHVPLVTSMGLELVPYAEWGVVGANRMRRPGLQPAAQPGGNRTGDARASRLRLADRPRERTGARVTFSSPTTTGLNMSQLVLIVEVLIPRSPRW